MLWAEVVSGVDIILIITVIRTLQPIGYDIYSGNIPKG